MDHFWNELAKVMGPVPATVQAALEQCKFIHGGLAMLDDAAIDHIEADIRRLPSMLRKSEAEVSALLAGYAGDVKDFRFMSGERSALKLIAVNISQYGFNRFYNPVRVTRTSVEVGPVISTATGIEAAREVKNKICDYYEKRRDDSFAEKDFCTRLADIRVDVRVDQNGHMARIICPFCDPKVASSTMIRRDKSGTWKVSNFSSHIKSKHDDMCYPGKGHPSPSIEEDFGNSTSRKRSHNTANNGYQADVYEEQYEVNQQMDGSVKIEPPEW